MSVSLLNLIYFDFALVNWKTLDLDKELKDVCIIPVHDKGHIVTMEESGIRIQMDTVIGVMKLQYSYKGEVLRSLVREIIGDTEVVDDCNECFRRALADRKEAE